ncbi:hypothetical protein Afil01_42490 [Actinorhabdospora filicis]|uniref:TIGR02678 family protein n=1 Tax=Actinorhabdospora filicis TaxID=1785913 RepID=A0A9W6SPD5_9ACTN|nr:TIGR02678 family protein [Actinorhabdospora filicis]GLZ79442.1 hypothetical protein Afil01_42490 [Actinorhabdospora filicis]
MKDALEARTADERGKVVRTLLRTPLLTPKDEIFTLARRHGDVIAQWFARETGWIVFHSAGAVRLRKHGILSEDGSRGAQEGAAPFGRRRYVLVCLALAVLERADKQVTLGRLAERIVHYATDPVLTAAGIEFTLRDRSQRGDLSAVAKLLFALGVLDRVAGDEDAYVAGSGDVLYDVNRHVLAELLANRRGPSTVDEVDWAMRLATLAAEYAPDTDDDRNRIIRHSLSRRLLDDPVLYFADLTEAEREYLASQRVHLLRRITEFSGLVAEVRAEGIALLDPSGEATDYGMPEEGTEGHATLLVAEHLAGLDRARPGVPVAITVLEAHIAARAPEFASYWSKAAREPGAERELVAKALHRLASLRLLRVDGTEVTGLPALARYAFAAPKLPGERS